MSARLLIAAVSLLGLALAACSPPEPGHDVAFYKDHARERATQLATCGNDPGRLEKSPNCINALRADADAASEKAWSTPKTPSRVRNPDQL
jgi:hypothetical protein